MPSLSVIIATYNRSRSLEDTLDSLLLQEEPDSPGTEIIIVDNNSTDDTRQTVERKAQGSRFPLKYFLEPRQGLSAARNRGIKEASGDIIAFTDDDCLPERSWLRKISKIFQTAPRIDCLLGNAVMDDGSTMYDKKDLLRGNGLNMAFRRSVFERIGTFDLYLGSGSVGKSGEDTDFIYRLIMAGGKIIQRDDVLVIHKQRQNEKQALKFLGRDAEGYVILWLAHILRHGDWNAAKNLARYFIFTGTRIPLTLMRGDFRRARRKTAQMWGGLRGVFRGFYIWVFMYRRNQCRR